MNEIEYAIKQLERRADAVSSIGEFEEYNALATALTVLRAELARQDAKPLTWDERINQMTVEEKRKLMTQNLTACVYKKFNKDVPIGVCSKKKCGDCWEEFFASPYTEGETV